MVRQVNSVTVADRRAAPPIGGQRDSVRLTAVSKVFGRGDSAVRALDKVSLEVPPGEFTCLIGASGCGKSTLLSLVAGLELPTSGEVSTGGGRVAFMFQEPALFPWMTVLGNVEFALRMVGVSSEERRDRALGWLSKVHSRFRTPVNALITGALVSVLFVLLVYYQPNHNVDLGFITYPANTTALYSLVSFGVSGIYLSFLLAVIASIIARARGWVPEGAFTLGKWGWTVTIIAASYLGLMLLNVVVPSGLSSGRALFNLDWITLLVMVIIAVVGALYFIVARPDRKLATHVHDTLEPTGAERHG